MIRIQIVIFSVIVLFTLTSCSKSPLPEVYGIFIQDRGRLTKLELNMPEEERRNFSKDATIIILDKRLGNTFVNPDEMVRILNRKYVRYNVEIVLEHKGAPPKAINITPADYFGAFGESLEIMIGPIKNQNEIVKIKPKEPFTPGMYYLEFLEDRYPFSIELGGIPERNNPLNGSLDKYYTTVDKDASFSWDSWFALTQKDIGEERIFNGNTILNTRHEFANVLDEDINKSKKMHCLR